MRSLRPGLSGLVPAGVTVLVASLAGAGVASADPIDDQRSKVEQYADMIEALEEETARLAEEYDIALDELGQLEDDVAAAEEAVAEKEAEVADLQAELGDVAVQAYLDSGTSGMGIFSEPSQFSEELQRDELTRVALNNGTADSDDLEAGRQRADRGARDARGAAGGGGRQGRRGRRRPRGGRGPDRGAARGPGRGRG